MAQRVMNLTGIHEDVGSIPGPAQQLGSGVVVVVAQAGSCSSISTPSPRTSKGCRYGPKKQKKKKNNNNNIYIIIIIIYSI